MSWDLALDPATGDFVFDGKHDLLGVMDAALVNQRIFVRLMIPRGTFQDDTTQTLGSDISTMSSRQHSRDDEVESVIQSALAPMTDIQILGIDVLSLDENGNVLADPLADNDKVRSKLAQITWAPASAQDEPADEVDAAFPTFQTNIRVSV